MQQEQRLSADEIAANLGINLETIYNWIDRKRLPTHRGGRLWNFKATEVDEWVREARWEWKTRSKHEHEVIQRRFRRM